MKKLLIPFMLVLVLLISACGNNKETNTEVKEPEATEVAAEVEVETSSDTIIYQSENGPIEVPANPERVIVLATFAGNVLALDVNLVGVDPWSKMNPRYDLVDVEEVTDESLEKIIELDPDLIIGLSYANNVDKLNEIAPTVTFTYGALGYLEQHLEIGKLLNKEAEAQAWIDDFKSRANAAGEEIRSKIGEDATVTVVENFDKELYVFGDNWARGTEILYQEMNLKMPDKVVELALEQGYYALSFEVLPEVAGDYIIFSKNSDSDTSFQETETYKNIPAVQKNQVFEVNAKEFYFNDPLTLEFQLEFFINHFLKN
ncbi:ABC transporter substrate-binding protein [Anaerobacillus isosaccharinicus]|uniref:ABC transporter substrate-binding protein n=1 Tax=Anaerobacillus isosaccharinicus TaxID=1532552 RepID=A0A1S2L2L6_9BACI|nr:iron-hydroxamate ABC transporter substrate-binding protein [Anaerobacillus isosaccharinicus]MBA5588285.1 ABC transporter substrate-binding protein [Anaerobacillus isosaccharinicus]QOY38278.1 ABC transporter substrate-binding protein [Anaerobacillus isosaccharinicus]